MPSKVNTVVTYEDTLRGWVSFIRSLSTSGDEGDVRRQLERALDRHKERFKTPASAVVQINLRNKMAVYMDRALRARS